jgi:hypothetical protein
MVYNKNKKRKITKGKSKGSIENVPIGVWYGIIINSLLAISSVVWHNVLHLDTKSPLYDSSVPRAMILIAIVIGVVDVFIFMFYIRPNLVLVAFIFNLLFIGIGFYFMYTYVFRTTPTETVPLTFMLIIDFINSLWTLLASRKK